MTLKMDAYSVDDVDKISEVIKNYFLLSKKPIRVMWGVFDTRGTERNFGKG